jgi:hypothetical protein
VLSVLWRALPELMAARLTHHTFAIPRAVRLTRAGSQVLAFGWAMDAVWWLTTLPLPLVMHACHRARNSWRGYLALDAWREAMLADGPLPPASDAGIAMLPALEAAAARVPTPQLFTSVERRGLMDVELREGLYPVVASTLPSDFAPVEGLSATSCIQCIDAALGWGIAAAQAGTALSPRQAGMLVARVALLRRLVPAMAQGAWERRRCAVVRALARKHL